MGFLVQLRQHPWIEKNHRGPGADCPSSASLNPCRCVVCWKTTRSFPYQFLIKEFTLTLTESGQPIAVKPEAELCVGVLSSKVL